LRYLKQAPCIRGGRIEAKRIFKGGRRIAEYCSLGGDRVFLLVAIGLADLQCLPGLFDPAQVALADAVPAAVEPNPSSSPNDLSTMIEISGTSFEAGAAVQLDAPSLDGEIGVSSTSLEATVPWGLDPGVYTLSVIGRDEVSGSLADAFTVTQGTSAAGKGGRRIRSGRPLPGV
jgi:hypothetical protein